MTNCAFSLKVHKNKNFFGFDFEFCTISLIVVLEILRFCKKKICDRANIGGDTNIPLSLRLSRIEFSLV